MTAGATYSPTNRFPWLAGVPLAQLLLETDAPYFPPRGAARQVALPGDVAHVAAAVAAVKDITVEEVLSANLDSVTAVYGVKIEPKPLGPDNKGYQLLVKEGWHPWSGLGLFENGIKIPVEAGSVGRSGEETKVEETEVEEVHITENTDEERGGGEGGRREKSDLKLLVDSTAKLIDTFLRKR